MEKSRADDFIIRAALALLTLAGQFLTVKELLVIYIDLMSGSLNHRFYVSLLFIAVVFPVSFLMLTRVFRSQDLMNSILSVYSFVLSVVVVAYYAAIQANFEQLYNSISSATFGLAANVEPEPVVKIVTLFALFALPLFGLKAFSKNSGGRADGIASIPLFAAFLWGCYRHLDQLRSGIGDRFLILEAPQMLMTAVLVVTGAGLMRRYFAQSTT